MSDDTTNNQNTTATGASNGTTSGPTFTQAELDRIVADRLARERKKYADYDDLKAAAATADKDKSELQKISEQMQRMQQDLNQSRAEALKADIAAAKNVPKALLTGSTAEELEASAEALIAFRGQAGTGQSNTGTTDDGAGDGAGDGNGENNDGTAGSSSGAGTTNDGKPAGKQSGTPRENLKSGTSPSGTGTEDNDPIKLAEQVPRW